MNWALLLPRSVNLYKILADLNASDTQVSSKAFSDLIIFGILCLLTGFCLWAIWKTIKSIKKTQRYHKSVSGSDNVLSAINSSDLPLFKEFQRHLIILPSRDGTDRMITRRAVASCEVLSDAALGPNFTNNRLLLAMPGILTGLGVLGTFMGLQMGIASINLQDLTNLDNSITPLISGCAVAFSTSVWGVFASLFFSGFEKAAEVFSHKYIRNLQILIDRQIKEYVPEEAMAELEQASRGTEDILKGLAVAIGDEMQKAIGRLGNEIKEAVEGATREGQGPLAEKSAELLANAITAELGNLKEQFAEMTNKFSTEFSGGSEELRKSLDQFQPLINDMSESVKNSQIVVANAVEKLNAHESVMEKMAQASVELNDAAGAFERMKDTLEASADRNEVAAKAQLESSKTNVTVAEKFEIVGTSCLKCRASSPRPPK